MIKDPIKEEYEKCVLCGELTSVPISMPIDLRENYEMGCGQLCTGCKQNLRKATEREDILSNTQVLHALEQSRNNNEK